MAKSATKAQIGDFVYKPFKILNPGKVIDEFINSSTGERSLRVKFLDGSIETIWDLQLNDFNHATEEHLKKYNKFDTLRKKLVNL